MSLLKALFDGNEREVTRLRRTVEQINSLESEFEPYTDEALAAKTVEFRSRLEPHVEAVVEAKEVLADALDAGDRARAQTNLKATYQKLEDALNEILPESFAIVREAAKRTLKQRHYDVQLLGGIALHQGRVAELATGEGKTLSSTCPLYLNALPGRGVHLVTPNDYLAKRDAVWNAPIFHLLGLTVGVIQNHPQGSAYVYDPNAPGDDPHLQFLIPVPRSVVYQCDVVYGTNAEFGFDYLRDNMAISPDSIVQRDLHYAIVDEMDSILIDEARTPLIISGMPEKSTDLYRQVDRAVAGLKLETDYTHDEKAKNAILTEEGMHKVEQRLGVPNLADNVELMHHVSAAVRARFAYRRDIEYVVKDGQVVIVDEFTGRLMFGRRYSDGLHQAIEAKEGVKIEEETQTVATITIQNYFRLYHKLAGMTGTAKTEENEIRRIYGMDVVVVPTNLPTIRKDMPDVVYKNEEQKFRALVLDILARHVKGQPLLVGTRSIEVSERLSDRLKIGEVLQTQAMILVLRDALFSKSCPAAAKSKAAELHAVLDRPLNDLYLEKLRPVAKALELDVSPLEPKNFETLKALLDVEENDDVLRNALENGIPHAVLNAKYHEREAEIIANAGRKHGVTIATNMAGRGVDIMLGGVLDEETPRSPTMVELSSGYEKTYPTEEAAQVAKLGGLAILGSERHESRRIDRQLRGRSGRQGDPGETRFYLSLEDELWRLFGNQGLQQKLIGGLPEYERMESRLLTRAIEQAQKKVEEHHFGQRKHTLEYDDVMNVQREVIYRQRRDILRGAELRDTILDHAAAMTANAVDRHCAVEIAPDEWDYRGLYDELDLIFDLSLQMKPAEIDGLSREELIEKLTQATEELYLRKEEEIASHGIDMREAERHITLRSIDEKWVEHLNSMEMLREGVWLRGYEQRDPLVIYKSEAFEMFNGLLESIQDEMVNMLFRLQVRRAAPEPPRPKRPFRIEPAGEDTPQPEGGADGSPQPPSGKKVGRNDPCPCGSGLKYKFCCLRSGK